MFTNVKSHGKNKIKFQLVSWFELDWTGRIQPPHGYVPRLATYQQNLMQDCGEMALRTVKCGMDTAMGFENYVM
ncbi:hypothetical protein TIFTF001_034232 [Ficus carica]|uniref:Uncharacterized protein n=1 Tax=Ficus carica TaxID=3494 RepID=A0AA88E004_FICCA|nr:hypothetical protein TIFTF001_034232 [Ficus carica]